MHFCSLSKSRKLHGVDHNGLSIESPEYGIVNYNEWINNVSRYLASLLSLLPLLAHYVQKYEIICFMRDLRMALNLNAFDRRLKPVNEIIRITFPFSLFH